MKPEKINFAIKKSVVYALMCVGSIFFLFTISCSKKSDPTPEKTKPKVDLLEGYYRDGDVRIIKYHGSNTVNLVVLGDGFIQSDLQIGGAYDAAVQKLVDFLFSIEPFMLYKDHFNIHVIYAESKRRGAVRGFSSIDSQTKFNAYFHDEIERLLMIGSPLAVNNYITKALPISQAHLKVVIVNDDRYGGAGGSFAVVSTHPSADRVAVHEVAHTFANLADEYVDEPIAHLYPMSRVAEKPNVDTTDNPELIKWKHYIEHPLYQSTVGAFEGAYYRSSGVFRPEFQSIMGTLNSTRFNAPSREAIAKRIHEIVDIPFDFEEFIQADIPNIQTQGIYQWIYHQTPMPAQVWYNQNNPSAPIISLK